MKHSLIWGMRMGTLWSTLEALPDRRTRKGWRYPLASIVGLSFAAMLSGANDLLSICRWGKRLTPKALEMLGSIADARPAIRPITIFSNRSRRRTWSGRWAGLCWPRDRSVMSPSTAGGCAAGRLRHNLHCTRGHGRRSLARPRPRPLADREQALPCPRRNLAEDACGVRSGNAPRSPRASARRFALPHPKTQPQNQTRSRGFRRQPKGCNPSGHQLMN